MQKKPGDPYEGFILLHLQHYGFISDNGSAVHPAIPIKGKLEENPDSSASIMSSASNISDSEEEPKPCSNFFSLEKVLRTRQLVFDFDGGRPIPRLRDPLDLFTIPSTSCPFQGVRWPIECEVIHDKIQQIEWEPLEPEPFYQTTSDESTPMPVGEMRGNTVFSIDPATKASFFTYSRIGGSQRSIKSATSCANLHGEPSLVFESRFESGNLQKAVQIGQHDYELTLRTDLYTHKHTQWFYFRVRNMRAGITYRFTIINLMKSSSLYGSGMRPLLYSESTAWLKGEGWKRAGNNIRYYKNNTEQEGKALYSLTWTLEFPHVDDTCYLAHCYPYTYSMLQHYLRGVISDPVRASYCKLRMLCRSLAGNAVYVLTITAASSSAAERKVKRAVVVTARVHPGETNSSWMMQGFLEFLLSDLPDARLLRETFIFKVIPMLNPDGVVVGNYRCSLAGRDLNRNYRSVLRDSFPCIWYTRSMVKRLLVEREVVVYCDFHGHSRKNNVFMYGCSDQKDASQGLKERVFPLMMSKNAKDKFSFRSCKFKMHKSKDGTGRIVMWRLGIRNSFTMESTFGGSTLGDRKGTHFSTGDLKSLGYCFCDTLLDFCDPDQTKTSHCLEELGLLLRQEVRQKLGREVDSLEDLPDIESSTSGSNSTESDGLPVHLLNASNQGKKKQLMSRKERNRLRIGRVRSAEPKTIQRIIKHLDHGPSEDETVKMRIDKKTSRIKSDTQKQKVPCSVRANKTIRSWIPHPTSHIGVLDNVPDLWDNRKEKIVHSGCATCRHPVSVDPGLKIDQNSTSSAPPGQGQQHTTPMTKSHKRCPSVPSSRERTQLLQPYMMPFYPNLKLQSEIKGQSHISNIMQRCKQRLKQERLIEGVRISVKHFMPLDTMGSLRISQTTHELGLALPQTEQNITGSQTSKQDACFLPDLHSRARLSRNQTASRALSLGQLTKESKPLLASTSSLSSVEKLHHQQGPQKCMQVEQVTTDCLPGTSSHCCFRKSQSS